MITVKQRPVNGCISTVMNTALLFVIHEDKEKITGYVYEPWHIRYVGKSTAKKIYQKGVTLEEYLGVN